MLNKDILMVLIFGGRALLKITIPNSGFVLSPSEARRILCFSFAKRI